MIEIKQLLGEEYLKRFRVFHPQTLFEPRWDSLKHKRCPLCFNLLKFPLRGGVAICSSNKHAKQFIIKLSTLSKLR